MDERDRELLARQMWWSQPPWPAQGEVMLFGAVLFLCGLIMGSLLFAPIERSGDRVQYAMQSSLEQTR